MDVQPAQVPSDAIDRGAHGLCILSSGAMQQRRLPDGTYVYHWCVLASICSREAPLSCPVDIANCDAIVTELPGAASGDIDLAWSGLNTLLALVRS